MTSVLSRASAVVAFVVLVCQLPQAAQQDSRSTRDLAAFFADAGGVARDTNDDGIADSVAARVIVPAAPSREDSLAAANIAGRLGFETTSLSLPLVLRDGDVRQPAGIEVPILVGRNNSFTAKLVEQGQITVNTLQPGQGLIAAVASPLGGRRGVGGRRCRRRRDAGGGNRACRAAAAVVEHDRHHPHRYLRSGVAASARRRDRQRGRCT